MSFEAFGTIYTVSRPRRPKCSTTWLWQHQNLQRSVNVHVVHVEPLLQWKLNYKYSGSFFLLATNRSRPAHLIAHYVGHECYRVLCCPWRYFWWENIFYPLQSQGRTPKQFWKPIRHLCMETYITLLIRQRKYKLLILHHGAQLILNLQKMWNSFM